MHLNFLGDALDHWKGSLFESLQQAEAVRDFAVDPMASDPQQWTEEDFTLYARLLRIRPERIIQHRATLQGDRAGYFNEISHQGDLFLDPDTGVATGRAKEPWKYATPSEVGKLLDASAGRLLVIYQHGDHRKPLGHRVKEVADSLGKMIGRHSWCSYEARTVAMLFLCRASARTVAVAQHFEALLGHHAANRIQRFESA